MDNDTFGGRLRGARESLHMSREDLAQQVSVRMQTIYRYESDRVPPPTVDIVKRLADALGVDFAWLAMGSKAGEAMGEAGEGRLGEDAGLAITETFLEQMGEAVSTDHACELRRVRFGTDDVTVDMIRSLWTAMLARDAGRASERPDLEPHKLRPGRVKLAPAKKKG